MRIKRLTPAFAAALIVTGCASAATSATATASTTPAAAATGNTHMTLYSIDTDGPRFAAIVTGAVGDHGQAVSVYPDGRVDPQHDRDLSVRLTRGSFLLDRAYAWLRRHPRAADGLLAALLLAASAGQLRISPLSAALAATAVLLYTLAAYRPRRISLAGLAVCLLGVAVTVVRWAPAHTAHSGGLLLLAGAGLGAIVLTAWVLGASMSYRRAYYGGLEDRLAVAERARELQEQRARAVDESAARLRRIERDLHNGAQVRLAALAMALGEIKENLEQASGDDRLLTLVGAAHRNAKDTLAELRDLARGIHPPVLDRGLGPALTLLAGTSAIPARLSAAITERPSPAIEAMAYFCVAELLANAAKHSGASQLTIGVREQDAGLVVTVADDGDGGARLVPGGGLAGLLERVQTVDGQLGLDSPPGGPTQTLTRRGHDVVAAVAEAESLRQAVGEHRPDVAIIDVRMPPTHTDEGLRAARAIHEQWPEVGVLVFSQYIETQAAAELFSRAPAGVGYLLKDRVAQGGTVLDTEVVRQLLSAGRRRDTLAALTPREREVLSLIAQGRSNAAIAGTLFISPKVVEKHVASIFGKLGLAPSDSDNRRVIAAIRYLES